ncbi:inhibitor of nuclear factor kappa-B kinase-interacting protein isoform X1 [Erpetoichthys calabaricus]|uniref:IKBKB interacting protein n=1 Tax=Erpetoichthys calabaricus TaxID=27687 RepID=A0A8C4SAG5_ERPCA|nr:inhibitor of nuclear factor kappa-B kinase-interacting protein isoform X1 [Erpetoichthys calabaricus]XP_028672727.1 inhibitor of nuclear factor kappa-B kinase-interacting protein isoform X1 [Erpetoichthys calabaricus]XP_051780710.1 inhibitor of nuclear factor kappa-B kinase-interacting protein isoform X1 [Erpetoichthys calabaricus]
MPSNEVKQRKKNTGASRQTEELKESLASTQEKASRSEDGVPVSRTQGPGMFVSAVVLLLLPSLMCLGLGWITFQQSYKFASVEEKYNLLFKKTESLQNLENELSQISKKLTSSEDEVRKALSSISVATKLERDVSSLHSSINNMQESEQSVSQKMKAINKHFQNVTDIWKESLQEISQDILNLKSEAKTLHSHVTTKINKAEKNVKILTERLEEFEASTKRNSRALERTEEDDVSQLKIQIDWHTKEVQQLEKEQLELVRNNVELLNKILEYQPKVERCEEQLPAVESAIHSILRLSSDLLNTEKRLEDLTVQVFGMEDSMLKAVSEILDIKNRMDSVQVENGILKLRYDLDIIKDEVKKLNRDQKASSEMANPETEN